MPTKTVNETLPAPTKLLSAKQVTRSLEELCNSLKPGDKIPRHTELMHRLGASERAVRDALSELQRNGRIVRRPRAGTFVADTNVTPNLPKQVFSMTDERTIVAITRPDYSFFNRCLDLLYRYSEAEDLILLCRPTDPTTQNIQVDPASMGNPLGFVLFGYPLAPLGKQLQDLGQRVVLIGAPPIDMTMPIPCIHGDHEQGSYLATNHLLELGHRRIAFAMIGEDHQTLRWTGHQMALREATISGETISDVLITHQIIDRWELNPILATEYFHKSDAPTGVVVWNDRDALRLLTVLSRAGIRVPEDVSLVGYDNLPESTMVYPRLTTVDQAIGRQLRMAIKLLRLPTPPPSSHVTLVAPTLITRESSAQAPLVANIG